MSALEDARAALGRFDKGWRSTNDLAVALRALIVEHERLTAEHDMWADQMRLLREDEAELYRLRNLTAPPADDEREALAKLLDSDECWYYTGTHMSLDPWAAAGHLIAAGFRRQGPITDAQVRAAAKAMYDIDAKLSMSGASTLARAALEAARAAS